MSLLISYVTLGSADPLRAAGFYDAVLAPLGQRRCYTDAHFIGWGPEGQDDAPASLWICVPFDGQPASAGNGTMVALAADSRAQVDAAYAAAIAAGGADEGPPGLRLHYDPTFYAAYFRDLDGHKLALGCRAPV